MVFYVQPFIVRYNPTVHGLYGHETMSSFLNNRLGEILLTVLSNFELDYITNTTFLACFKLSVSHQCRSFASLGAQATPGLVFEITSDLFGKSREQP